MLNGYGEGRTARRRRAAFEVEDLKARPGPPLTSHTQVPGTYTCTPGLPRDSSLSGQFGSASAFLRRDCAAAGDECSSRSSQSVRTRSQLTHHHVFCPVGRFSLVVSERIWTFHNDDRTTMVVSALR